MAAVALVAILAIFVVGVMDPNQWLRLGIAVGIIATGYAYYFCYLRSRAGTHCSPDLVAGTWMDNVGEQRWNRAWRFRGGTRRSSQGGTAEDPVSVGKAEEHVHCH